MGSLNAGAYLGEKIIALAEDKIAHKKYQSIF
jgi:hypothetical protein